MKIYPDAHYTYFRKQVSLDDIPLSYVYNEEKDRILDITVKPEFSKPYQEIPVYPYQIFPTNRILFFNKNGNPVENSQNYLQPNGTEYMLLPKDAQTFVPKKFSFNLLLRRDDTFKKTITYHITFGIKDSNEVMRNRIIAATQSQENRKEYPANIIINQGHTSIERYENVSESDCDFLFMPLSVYHASVNTLNEHTNLWIYDDSFNQGIEPAESDTYKLAESMLYMADSGELKSYQIRLKEGVQAGILDNTYQEINFFEIGNPLRIFYKPDGHYVIFSHPTFFEALDPENKPQLRLFMETILYVYLHAYCQTGTKTTFITDDTIHYFIDMAQRYYLTHPRINLDRLLLENGENPVIGHTIIRCNTQPKDTDTFTVTFNGTNRFNDLLFKKTNVTVKDPAKGNNVLVYTTKKKILFCNTEFANLRFIETGIQIREIDAYTIGVSAAKSSRYQIYTTEEQIISLPVAKKYTIYFDANKHQFVAKGIEEIIESSYVLIGTVTVTQNEDIQYQDIRQYGGGEASATPNYEMIDTGTFLGRPYRYGSSMIIRIPSRFKKLENEIQSEVEKHISSGEYPIILYKD